MTDTNNPYPITPPPELVHQWRDSWIDAKVKHYGLVDFIATQAAQWGSNQELEACCKLAPGIANYFRERRRPKPPTLNSIALQMLGTIERDAHYLPEITDTIRKALNQLPDS